MTVGGHYDIKAALLTIIAAADSELSPQITHVIPNWRLRVWQLKKANMPVVTVRIGPMTINETAFGRKIRSDETGNYVSCFFTAHVWAENTTTSGVMRQQAAMNLADTIIKYLENYNGDEATSGIAYFYDITFRETDHESGPLRYSRIIVEGFILVKRPIS